ncbi:MAG TPA: DUF4351 domain-containing protein [Thermoanaerobaculia bacterium]|jgi:hypothetical protein|nr:DUF4351 domain-containing protein [Thermoanaerobaculia bacterium]
MTGHDKLFKDLFRARFPDLLRLADADLAARWLADIGLRGIIFLDKEVFLPGGQRREVDLLAEIPDRSMERKFLIHLEIEHEYRTPIDHRVWHYSLQFHLDYSVPVMSIVVFLKGGPPGAQWLDRIEQVPGQKIHHFRYLSFGLSRLPAQVLLDRPEPLAWALASLARPGKIGRARLKLELLRKIATAPIDEDERFLLTNCVETYLQLRGRAAAEYAVLCAAQRTPEVETMRLTWAEQMEAEYRQKGLEDGRQQGLEQGIEKGMEKGVRNTLLRLLAKRFGKVSPAVRKRIEGIGSVEELGGLVDRILEIRSIEELGLGR